MAVEVEAFGEGGPFDSQARLVVALNRNQVNGALLRAVGQRAGLRMESDRSWRSYGLPSLDGSGIQTGQIPQLLFFLCVPDEDFSIMVVR